MVVIAFFTLMWSFNSHALWIAYLHIVGVSSALHNLLPPWDWDAAFLNDFPKAQVVIRTCLHNRWYKLVVTVVGIIALNGRSLAWPSIAMPKQIERMNGSQK